MLNLNWRVDWFREVWIRSVTTETKRNIVTIALSLRKYITKTCWKHHQNVLCQETAFTEWFLKSGDRVLFASSQGYTRKQLACAASAAAHSQVRREKQLARGCDLGKWSRNAGWNERRTRGKSLWKQLADRFKSGRWYWSQRTRKSLQMHSWKTKRILKKSKEWKLVRTNFYSRSSGERQDDMGPVAERWSLSDISSSTQLDRRMGQIFRLHRAARYPPQRTLMAKRTICQSDSSANLDSNKQAGPSWERLGYKEAKWALASLQKAEW